MANNNHTLSQSSHVSAIAYVSSEFESEIFWLYVIYSS